MSEIGAPGEDFGLDVDDALARFRDYLETGVDWSPVIPPADELPREERWQRICTLLLEQSEAAGREALAALPTIRALDRDGTLTARLDRLDDYLDEGDYSTALTLFAGEHGNVLIAMGNETFAGGDLAGARQIFAFAHLANPTMVEPLIGRLTVEWEDRGPERAADLYAAVVDIMRNPMLDLFAADCFRAAGRDGEADALLQRSLKQIEEDDDVRAVYGDLAGELRASLPAGSDP